MPTANGPAGRSFPRDFDFNGPEAAEGAGQPWTATTWTLNTLRDWGLDAAALAGTADLLAANSRWEYDDLPYWGGEVDCCINAFTLANGVWLGRGRVRASPSGSSTTGWPTAAGTASGSRARRRSSFHSTLNSLKGLLVLRGRDRRHGRAARGPPGRRGVPARAPAVAPPVDRRARRAVGDSLRLPVPLGLQRAERGGLLPGGGVVRRHRAGSSAGGRDRGDPRRPPPRRHLAAGAAAPGRVWFEVDVPPASRPNG